MLPGKTLNMSVKVLNLTFCVQVSPKRLHHAESCQTEVLGGSRGCSERLQHTPGQSRMVPDLEGALEGQVYFYDLFLTFWNSEVLFY